MFPWKKKTKNKLTKFKKISNKLYKQINLEI